MRHKAVLFDLDGTLLDTIEDLTDSMNLALAQSGFAPRTVEECKLFVGDGVESFARRALPAGHRNDRAIAACVEAMRADYTDRWRCKTRPYDGVAELLDGLDERGIAMAVLSNKPDSFTKQMVEAMLGRWHFAAVFGARPGVPKKPDPTAALGIAERMGVAPGEFLYLGDTNTDMRTANAAGMYAVGALWGFRSAEELRGSGARVLVERPPEVLRL